MNEKRFGILISFCFFALLCSCSQNKSSVYVRYQEQDFQCAALNANAKKAVISQKSKSPYIFLEFPAELQEQIASRTEDLAFFVSLQADSGSSDNQKTGCILHFLYDADFVSSRNLKKELYAQYKLSGRIPSVYNAMTFALKIPTEKKAELRGLALYSEVPLKVVQICLKESFYGYQFDQESCLLGFTEAGGILPRWHNDSLEFFVQGFTGQFDGIELTFRNNPGDIGILGSQKKVVLQGENNGNQEKITIRRAPHQNSVFIPFDVFSFELEKFLFLESLEMVKKIEFKRRVASSVSVPFILDPGLILSFQKEKWRHPDFEIFEWENIPNVLIFDTKDYMLQDRFFKRLAFYVEKTGWTGKIWSDYDLRDEHGFNAHDYRAESLAAFYSQAQSENFSLNEHEIFLREILVSKNIIVPSDSGYEAGFGAVISLSQESPDYLRYQFMAHELFHGLYFISEAYRKKVEEIYYKVDKGELAFMQRYFEVTPSLRYDIHDDYLMKNEFMGYLMQQPTYRVTPYFAENLASRWYINESYPELVEYIKETQAKSLTWATEQLEQFVFDNWGVAAGRVGLITIQK